MNYRYIFPKYHNPPNYSYQPNYLNITLLLEFLNSKIGFPQYQFMVKFPQLENNLPPPNFYHLHKWLSLVVQGSNTKAKIRVILSQHIIIFNVYLFTQNYGVSVDMRLNLNTKWLEFHDGKWHETLLQCFKPLFMGIGDFLCGVKKKFAFVKFVMLIQKKFNMINK
jgi:hypothetical protein